MSSSGGQGNLRLKLVDVNGDNIGGRASLRLRHQVLSDLRIVNDQDASKRINVSNLFGIPQGLYRIDVNPSAYLPTSRFITIKASGVTDVEITCAINPKQVKSLEFPEYSTLPDDTRRLLENSDQVPKLEGKKGEELYKALDDLRRANVLNLTAKCNATPLANGKTVLSLVEKIVEIRGDRFFCVVPKELRQETKNSAVEGLFNPAPDTLHTPPPGFGRAGSFKTPDKFGNLQLTFFLNGDDCMSDIDIDPASGIEHMFQVIEHRVKDIETHPYAVRDILIKQQEIDPGYHFMV